MSFNTGNTEILTTEVLVIGGGTGGTAAAIQSARRGANTILVSEFSWLGGMLTSAGVSAPDGNELAAFQTGIWGAFLQELRHRQSGGLNHAWVSFFTYDPRIGAQIFEDWVKECHTLHWISGYSPVGVETQGDRLTGVHVSNSSSHLTIRAQVVLDATELGDLLALADVPHRWGWEWQSEWHEPSAPIAANELTQRYPVQAPTWVVVLQDFGADQSAPEIPVAPGNNEDHFVGAWDSYGAESFLNYGRLPGDRFMINWPQQGNDYGEKLERLVISDAARHEFLRDARWHSQNFARYIQTHLGHRYGLADDVFPWMPNGLGGGAFALHPYYRESRRLCGLTTVTERDILPMPEGCVAALPLDEQGKVEAIAFGNYANDHHYPRPLSELLTLKPKSMRWGGRWTGTPFAIPYRCLIPTSMDGLLVCEKNISVSHIANGSTRLQPIVLGIGQAAGMAAALCVEQLCEPRQLPVRRLQEALLCDATAPAAVIPLLNGLPNSSNWGDRQRYYLDHPDHYPMDGNDDGAIEPSNVRLKYPSTEFDGKFSGLFNRHDTNQYTLTLAKSTAKSDSSALILDVVTLDPVVHRQLQTLPDSQRLTIWGNLNRAGGWILADKLDIDARY
ncbi:MAG: FAD-dependent oxidoreductase [Elainellaceae cyanobacterium]